MYIYIYIYKIYASSFAHLEVDDKPAQTECLKKLLCFFKSFYFSGYSCLQKIIAVLLL